MLNVVHSLQYDILMFYIWAAGSLLWFPLRSHLFLLSLYFKLTGVGCHWSGNVLKLRLARYHQTDRIKNQSPDDRNTSNCRNVVYIKIHIRQKNVQSNTTYFTGTFEANYSSRNLLYCGLSIRFLNGAEWHAPKLKWIHCKSSIRLTISETSLYNFYEIHLLHMRFTTHNNI
jgi:hypothetical protein